MALSRTPLRVVYASLPPSDGMDDLLDCAGPLCGAHVLVIGPAPSDLLVRLIRRGAVAAACLHRDDHSTAADSADIVLVPRCEELSAVAGALTLARRVLTSGGRVVLRDTPPARAPLLAKLLGMAGFGGIRCRARPSGALLTADLAFFGPVPR